MWRSNRRSMSPEKGKPFDGATKSLEKLVLRFNVNSGSASKSGRTKGASIRLPCQSCSPYLRQYEKPRFSSGAFDDSTVSSGHDLCLNVTVTNPAESALNNTQLFHSRNKRNSRAIKGHFLPSFCGPGQKEGRLRGRNPANLILNFEVQNISEKRKRLDN